MKKILVLYFTLCCLTSPLHADQVQELIQDLNEKESFWAQRSIAAQNLGRTGDERALAPLLDLLNDPNENTIVRSTALDSLFQLKHPQILEIAIATRKKTKDWYVRTRSIALLGKLQDDPRAFHILVQGLHDPTMRIRLDSTQALADWGTNHLSAPALEARNARIVEPLINILRDDEQPIRISAAKALGNTKDERAIEPLIAALNDKSSLVRQYAVSLLGAFNFSRIPESIVPLLLDEDKKVRETTAMTLGVIGGDRAITGLLNNFTDWHTRNAVAKSLLHLGWTPQSVFDHIHLSIAESRWETLRTGWEETRQVLLGDLKTGNTIQVEYVLYAFIAIGKEVIIPTLINHLDSVRDPKIAQTYLNCGRLELQNAAKDWAKKYGYKIVQDMSAGAGPRWKN